MTNDLTRHLATTGPTPGGSGSLIYMRARGLYVTYFNDRQISCQAARRGLYGLNGLSGLSSLYGL